MAGRLPRSGHRRKKKAGRDLIFPSTAGKTASSQPSRPFDGAHFLFDKGERIEILDVDGNVVLSFDSFASVTGVVAALVAAIIAVAGLAAAAFLVSEGSIFRALVAAVITVMFASSVAALAPRLSVTLQHGETAVLHIRQTRLFPTAAFMVSDASGGELARLHRPLRSRAGRERWEVRIGERAIAEALESSRRNALLRGLFGWFSRRWTANLHLTTAGISCAKLTRRGAAARSVEITGSVLDPRIAVALGVLIFGGER